MAAVSERKELAELCCSRDWSKAIRVLDTLLSHSSSIQDLCNRAFCYSQLELHKHVIKDCDRALKLDPNLLQPYILKGRALSALGKKDDGLLVWEQGYEIALHQSTDLKQLLELEELLTSAKQNRIKGHDDHARIDCARDSSIAVISASESRSEICSKPTDAPEIHSKAKGARSEICSKPTDASEIHSKAKGARSEICSKPTNTPEIHSKAKGASVVRNGQLNGSVVDKKVLVTSLSKTKSISLDFRLSRGIAQVNEGKYDQAVSIFNQILRDNSTSPEALIGRGTAYAFQRELEAAIADFTKAIKSNPLAGEAWKRRGQARAALGESVEAIEDLSKALEFEPNSADILHERGIVNFKFKDYNAAVQDLSLCVKLDEDNKSAYTYFGLALSSIGEYKRAEEALQKSIQLDPNFVDGWTHLAQFYQELANMEKAFECLEKLQLVDKRCAKAYHLYGLLHHGMGQHRNAIKYLSTGLTIESSNIECLYLRASCYHAVGEYGEAVKDYDTVLELELDSVEKFVLQCMAFYQKELALYTASKVNNEFCWFDIDGDLDPLFKEYWCKRLHPKRVCEKVFRLPSLRDSLRKGRLRKQDIVITKQKAALLLAADSIGKKIQYSCQGFLHNRRQYRMAGLAVIEIAQKVSKAWRSLQVEWKLSSKGATKNGKKFRKKEKVSVASQNRGGACCSTSSSSEPSTSYGLSDDRLASGQFMISWQDIYNLAVRWRQISEPCDPVVWINKLSDEDSSGFGSHTPIILGQAKVVRYFPNYQRTLNVAKAIIEDTEHVYNAKDELIDLSDAGKLQNVRLAETCSDLYSIVGENFWLSTKCYSTAYEGKHLDGTRITLQKMGEKGFDFAIKTPCVPARWDQYDTEMAMVWEALCNVYCGELYGSTDINALENVKDAILRMTYYWYNFMPLSRGSAVVGYVVLLGLFLAANMEVTACIPQGVQVDWEAILSSDPATFISSIKAWLYPSLKMKTSWKDYPDVASTFSTTASVIAALSTYND